MNCESPPPQDYQHILVDKDRPVHRMSGISHGFCSLGIDSHPHCPIVTTKRHLTIVKCSPGEIATNREPLIETHLNRFPFLVTHLKILYPVCRNNSHSHISLPFVLPTTSFHGLCLPKIVSQFHTS